MRRAIEVSLALAVAVAALWFNVRLAKSPGEGNFDLERSRSFTDFPLYYLGESYDGFPLLRIDRTVGPAVDGVDFIYGHCERNASMRRLFRLSGCGPPIQVSSACVRNPSLYEKFPAEGISRKSITVRGVPATLAGGEGDLFLDLYTGSAAVTVFLPGFAGEDSEAWLLRVAEDLKGLNNTIRPGQSLPSPSPGALEGTLQCPART